MSLFRPRPLLIATLAALALAGCGVPGEGEPGVAAVYKDRVITSSDVEGVYTALDALYSRPHPGEDLTLLLLGPGAITLAEDLGAKFTDATLRADALMWMSSQQGDQVEPTPGTIEIVKEVRAIAYLMNNPDGIVAFVDLVKDVEANTVASPRYGTFTFDHFTASIAEVSKYLDAHGVVLGPAAFLAYKDVDGFTSEAYPSWVSSD